MNLGKLLGAGKSIFGGEAPVVYRQSKQVSLPKFNAGKNPFVSEAPKAADARAGCTPVPAPTPSMHAECAGGRLGRARSGGQGGDADAVRFFRRASQAGQAGHAQVGPRDELG